MSAPTQCLLAFCFTILFILPCHAQITLKDAFKDYFLIGAALNQSQFSGLATSEISLITAQFNSISPENALKWAAVHPAPNRYDFTAADRYVEFGEAHHMFIVGHNLVWHYQTPAWVFQDESGKPVDRDTLLKRMRDHISTVVGRYRGRIAGWDVVNEALNNDGTLRQSPWLQIIGEDYLVKAYQFAHEADPHAQLYYNDYMLELPAKRAGAIALIQKLQAQGIHVAVGLQGHYWFDRPTTVEIDDAIKAFSNLGVNVMITELDVDALPLPANPLTLNADSNFELKSELNPYTNGLPDIVQQTLAKRYADIFAVFLKNRAAIKRVTFWGVTDADSWLNYWPVRGRTNYPLLFDRRCRPKPAFDAVVRAARSTASP
ncbi:MAG TPA: endo-1,4-beta-xylanase [Verrucomicrobiae bacterium]|nr:endo-1,4-beta-xylanase [Verrucomicrobiae bacterium]